MASADVEDARPSTTRSRRHARKSSHAAGDDWPRSHETDDLGPNSPPYPRWRRRGDLIDPPADDGRTRRQTLEPPPTSPLDDTADHLSRSMSMSMRTPTSVVPVGFGDGVVQMRAPAPVVEHRRPTYIYEVGEERSRSDSRRSTSRRDGSPRSGHPYRSTPDSKRSLANSVSDAEDETDTTVSSEEDDRDRRARRAREKEIPPLAPDPSRHHPGRHHRPRRGELVYEEDFERRHRYPPPVIPVVPVDQRSPSRHSSEKEVPYRRPRVDSREPRLRESVDESSRSPSRSARRPRNYESEMVYTSKVPSGLRRSQTYHERGSNSASSPSVSSSRRSASFLGNFFGPALHAAPAERPVKLVECLVCMGEKPSHKTAKLRCGHRMCHSCLKRVFKLSLTDPQHMPPKCCTAEHIPLKHVDRLFDTTFKETWNRKFAEYSTRNRIYCPSRRCGEWIKPEDIYREDGRKCGKCRRCKTKVCYACNGKWHRSLECPRDEETTRILEQAKQEGWQRCHRCKAIVELKEGCNHMTCRCGAEFCMICGAKWKTCDCPWFNYDAVENDRLEHMQIPLHVRTERDPIRGGDSRFEHPSPPSPRESRSSSGPAPAAVRPRPQSYEEEMLLRRLQEQRDEDLARRLQSYGNLDDSEDTREKYRLGDVVGIGNSAGHLMNENYRRGPHTYKPPASSHPSHIATSAHPSHGAVSSHPSNLTYPPHAAYERGDSYVSGVNKARGLPRASSLERRLADRFNPDARLPPLNAPNPMNLSRATGPAPQSVSHAAQPPMSAPGPYTAEPMPMAPVPPPAVPIAAPIAPVSRRYTMEEDEYSSPRHGREKHSRRSRRERERDREREREREYIEGSEPEIRMPSLRRRHTAQAEVLPKDSVLAGLTGPGRGMDRVYEWRNYVAPGPPETEATTVMA